MSSTLPTSAVRFSNIGQNFFFLLNTCTKFLLTDVSLSLTPSETLRGVAAVSEVAPCSVLINHPQSLHSPLSLSLSPSPSPPSLSLLISARCLSLLATPYLCFAIPPHPPFAFPPYCLSVFISPSCQSLRPSPAISDSPALILSFLFPLFHSLSFSHSFPVSL